MNKTMRKRKKKKKKNEPQVSQSDKKGEILIFKFSKHVSNVL